MNFFDKLRRKKRKEPSLVHSAESTSDSFSLPLIDPERLKQAASLLSSAKESAEKINSAVTVQDFSLNYNLTVANLLELIDLNEEYGVAMTPPPRQHLEKIQANIDATVDNFIRRAYDSISTTSEAIALVSEIRGDETMAELLNRDHWLLLAAFVNTAENVSYPDYSDDNVPPAASPISNMSQPAYFHQQLALDKPEQIPNSPYSVISYQEALSLKYWNRRRSDYVLTSCYIDGATCESLKRDLSHFLDLGLLTKGDIRDRITLKTVPELKEFLRNANLKVSGNKPELVQRILDNFSESQLSNYFSVSKYRLTEAGKAALEPYSIVFLANQYYHFNISYYRMMQAKADNPGKTDEEILLPLMLESAESLYKKGEIYSYRFYLGNIARFLESMRRPIDAFKYYSISFFISSVAYEEKNLYWAASPDTDTAFHIEKCARDSGLSFQQMVTYFVDTIRGANPFELGTEQNIKTAVNSLGAALGS